MSKITTNKLHETEERSSIWDRCVNAFSEKWRLFIWDNDRVIIIFPVRGVRWRPQVLTALWTTDQYRVGVSTWAQHWLAIRCSGWRGNRTRASHHLQFWGKNFGDFNFMHDFTDIPVLYLVHPNILLIILFQIESKNIISVHKRFVTVIMYKKVSQI